MPKVKTNVQRARMGACALSLLTSSASRDQYPFYVCILRVREYSEPTFSSQQVVSLTTDLLRISTSCTNLGVSAQQQVTESSFFCGNVVDGRASFTRDQQEQAFDLDSITSNITYSIQRSPTLSQK